MNREQAKEDAKKHLDRYLAGKGINTRKLFKCLNPDHLDKHPSMSYDNARNRVKCFSCGASYDIFSLVALDYGLTENKDIFKKTYEICGIMVDEEYNHNMNENKYKSNSDQDDNKVENKHYNYYMDKKNNFSGSPAAEYIYKRGISQETADKMMLGYDPNYSVRIQEENKQQKYVTWQALVIPTGKNNYTIRNIDENAPKDQRHRKGGATTIYNKSALKQGRPVFIVEGVIDALSIIEVGFLSSSIQGATITDELVKYIQNNNISTPLILALDNDEAGLIATQMLKEKITNAGLKNIVYESNLYGIYKDANELLVNDRELLIKELQEAEAQCIELEEEEKNKIKEEYIKTSAKECLKGFIDDITSRNKINAISTGFIGLDKALDGGLYEGLYVIGAISSLGKTTYILQVADQVAEKGQDCIIFSMEMARNELMAKSISRITYTHAEDKRLSKTTRGILSGARYENYTQQEKNTINNAIQVYSRYADHIFIHEGVGDIGVEQITNIVDNHIAITGNKPVVIIDYLQILAPYDMKATDKQNTDKAVLELKRMSRDKHLPVIAISSFNRDSYKGKNVNQGKVTMSDFKESGAIEYGADVLIGFQFGGAGAKEYDEENEKTKNPRDIKLIIMKNRNGVAWQNVSYKYYPRFNYFEEYSGDFEPVENKRDDPFDKMRGMAKNKNIYD